MLALGVVAMMCAVAIIGIGYATFGGTARTYNEGNTATAGNILIENESFTAMISAAGVEFDTYSAESGDAYYFESGGATVNSLFAKQVGDAKDLTVNNRTGAAITALTVGAKSSVAITNAEFIYFFEVSITNLATATPADDDQMDARLYLYYSGDSGVTFTPATPAQMDARENLYYCAPVVGYINLPAATTEQTVTISTGTIADNKSVTVSLQLYIGYAANCSVPDTFIGDLGAAGADDSIDAIRSATGPVDVATVNFGFSVADGTN